MHFSVTKVKLSEAHKYRHHLINVAKTRIYSFYKLLMQGSIVYVCMYVTSCKGVQFDRIA